jgi:hypothetical protein
MSTARTLRARPPAGGRRRPPPDDYVPAAEIGALYPGRPRRAAAVTRHITQGIALPGGGRLRLKARRSPSGWVVSVKDFEEFLGALTSSFRERHGIESS